MIYIKRFGESQAFFLDLTGFKTYRVCLYMLLVFVQSFNTFGK